MDNLPEKRGEWDKRGDFDPDYEIGKAQKAHQRREQLSRDEFFKQAQAGDFSDTMEFVVRREDSLGLSENAFVTVGHQMHDFVVARAVGAVNRTGIAPNGVKVTISVEYEAPTQQELMDDVHPWYAVDDVVAEPLALDGTINLAAMFELQKEGQQ